jgi:hypothetical protein
LDVDALVRATTATMWAICRADLRRSLAAAGQKEAATKVAGSERTLKLNESDHVCNKSANDS